MALINQINYLEEISRRKCVDSSRRVNMIFIKISGYLKNLTSQAFQLGINHITLINVISN